MTIKILTYSIKLKPEQLFMLSVLIVNAGNYFYNLILGRILGPKQFADAAIIITFLLVLSFIAMTFQLVTAKFAVLLDLEVFKSFVIKMYKNSFFVGTGLGALIICFSKQLQSIFNTSSSQMFVVFGLGVPLYFLMSVNRGIYQGKEAYKPLSITYQTEMVSRLAITLILIFSFKSLPYANLIALGVIISFVFGLVPFNFKSLKQNSKVVLNNEHKKAIKSFFIITAFYEFTQIIINNSDILLVKHYFEAYQAGLYASMALIGRIVYFIAWMFVMLLLPKVIRLKKEGKSTSGVLLKYVLYIAVVSFVIVAACFLFPKIIITLLFGSRYISMSNLLWQYGFATALFAISNIFAYYYLSLNKYWPVVVSGVFGMLQIAFIVFYHNTLKQVVHMQIITMVILLFAQLLFYKLDKTN